MNLLPILQFLFVVAIFVGVALFAALIIYAIESDWHRARFRAYNYDFDSYRLDKTTGFPQLPHGWFWRVSVIDQGGRFERLSITLLDWKGGHHGSEDFYTSIYRHHRLMLRIQANTILRRLQAQNRPDLNPSRWAGNYPPKDLRTS